MSQQHTPEPWRVFSHSWSNTSVLADGFDHAICGLDINHATEESQESDEALMGANARRIVACVNACAGIPTEALEDGSARAERDQLREMTGGTFYEIKKQRDELMKALEHQCEVLNRNGYSTNKAQEAIARVKGGA